MLTLVTCMGGVVVVTDQCMGGVNVDTGHMHGRIGC